MECLKISITSFSFSCHLQKPPSAVIEGHTVSLTGKEGPLCLPLSLSPSGVKAGLAAGGKGWSRRGGPARGVSERAALSDLRVPLRPRPRRGSQGLRVLTDE